ncbi:THUMP-like domain-containing protein [Allokutzneria oryzae]|uniref:Class I SAM-dependent methyltransferase n=1 Tax=Allokutzneria oryzae TaxID=1378989 RepID=A0ABV6A5L3_9PSEU
MGYGFTVEDVEFLRSSAGGDALGAAAELPLTPASRLGDVAAVRRSVGERFASAVLETAVLRRRAVSKLDGSDSWLLTDDAVQQATASVVARHRAQRLEGRDVHDVTCSIGAELVAVAEVADRCVGSDVDGVRLAMARHNCAVAGAPVGLVRADALRPVSRGTVVLADPARRDGTGRRKWRPEDLVPPLGDLVEVYRGRDMAVKCAPGLDFDAVPWADEVEVVSLAGQVREACAWVGAPATFGVRRRATVLGPEGPLWTVTDAESDDCPEREVGEWIIDPDGAVVRAGLVRHYAARHGLGQLDARIAYLTGDAPPRGVRAFRVLEHGKYNEKTLRALLRERGVGRLEILVRGLDIDPDALRKRLKISGPEEATVVLTRVGDTPTAYLCRAERV